MNWQAIEDVAVAVAFWNILVAMVVFIAQLVLPKLKLKPAGLVLMGVGLLGSGVALAARGIIAQHAPWSNLYESMLLMLFATISFYFLIELWYKPRHFGVFASPLALLVIGGASLLPPGLKAAAPLMPALQSYWIKIHTSAILISYGAFTISFAASMAYFVCAWQAKRNAKLATAGGPSAEVSDGWAKQLPFFDELTYRTILLGFPLLMFGIVTGAMWANSAWGTYWSWDPKETWSLITWFIYAAYLHARLMRDWTGPKAAGLAALGFVAMLVTYIGVNYLSTGLHSYGFLR